MLTWWDPRCAGGEAGSGQILPRADEVPQPNPHPPHRAPRAELQERPLRGGHRRRCLLQARPQVVLSSKPAPLSIMAPSLILRWCLFGSKADVAEEPVLAPSLSAQAPILAQSIWWLKESALAASLQTSALQA